MKLSIKTGVYGWLLKGEFISQGKSMPRVYLP